MAHFKNNSSILIQIQWKFHSVLPHMQYIKTNFLINLTKLKNLFMKCALQQLQRTFFKITGEIWGSVVRFFVESEMCNKVQYF